MSKPYGVISDLHCHAWDAFSTTLPTQVNSRLQIIIDEAKRAAAEVKARGGDLLIVAGDVFHVRGSLAPSVLNPTQDAFDEIVKSGVNVIILSGNHDLESKTSSRLSSAITALEKVGCSVVNELRVFQHLGIAMIPWNPSINGTKTSIGLKAQIESIDVALRPELDLFIHAPVDDVIIGIPSHGLDATYLASLGFRTVMSGHYHNHKYLGNGVWSIGATTQQTWGDVDTKAGYLIVDHSLGDKAVSWRASHAPQFVEIDSDTDPAEIPMIVDGNYVRAKINSNKSGDIEGLRSYLIKHGAVGVNILPQKSVVASVTRASIAAGATVEGSISAYITGAGFANPADLALRCNDVLNRVRSSS